MNAAFCAVAAVLSLSVLGAHSLRPEDVSEACARLGRCPQRLSARIDHPCAKHDRAARMGVRPLRHHHPHRFAIDHQVADSLQAGNGHRQRRTVSGPQSRTTSTRSSSSASARSISMRSSAPTCCASSATMARDSWPRMPARRRSSRGRNSATCWAADSTSIRGVSPKRPSSSKIATSPITQHLPASFAVTDEHYQLKDFSRDKIHVLARLDASKLDLKAPLVHRTDRDFVGGLHQDLRQRAACSIRRSGTRANCGISLAAEDVLRSAEVVDGAVEPTGSEPRPTRTPRCDRGSPRNDSNRGSDFQGQQFEAPVVAGLG